MTPNEIADIALIIMSQVGVIEKAIKDGRLDGKTPVPDKDYLSKDTAISMLSEAVNGLLSRVDIELNERGGSLDKQVNEALQRIRDGKDGIVSEEEIERAAEIAATLIDLPDFDSLIGEKLTTDGSSIRNALELLQGDDRLSVNAIAGLEEKLAKIQPTIIQGGTIGKQQVYGFIRQAIADGTIGAGAGYTNLTEFVNQTPYRVFYSDANGDVTELAFGADGTFLKSNGASSAPSFATPAGSGDVLGPATNTDSYIPQWDGLNSKVLKNGIPTSTFAPALGVDDNYVTDAEKVVIGNTSGTNSGDNAVNTLYSGLAASKQDVDADLTAIAALATTGIAVRTGAGTWAVRDMSYPAAGLTITNSTGVAGNPTFALANDLAALEALSGTGIPERTGADTWSLATTVLKTTDVDDTPVNGATTDPISSNWAFDHEADTSTHGVSTVAGISEAQVFTNKRITPRVYSAANNASLTPEKDTYDIFHLTAMSANTTINNHSTTTPADGDKMQFRFLDNGTARTLTWGTAYVAKGGIALPSTTVLGKNLSLGFEYNSNLSKWNLLASAQEA
jgi:hypothetical protein